MGFGPKVVRRAIAVAVLAALPFASTAWADEGAAEASSAQLSPGDAIADYVQMAANVRGVAVDRPSMEDGDPLAGLIAAAERADELRRQSIASISEQEWTRARRALPAIGDLLPRDIDGPEDVRFDDAAMRTILGGVSALDLDQAAMTQATLEIAAALDELLLVLESGEVPQQAGATSTLGEVVVDNGSDGTCDDVYDRPVFLIIDTCGNDRYLAPAGGADGLGPVPISIVVDTVGNDEAVEGYGWSGFEAPSVGAASNGGIAIFVDVAGDDRWGTGTGAHLGGSGLLGGFGIMVDTEGDDRWLASGFLAPGGKFGTGHFAGTGLLVDVSGHDTYRGDTFQQGSGWFGDSLGMLIDLQGNDIYDDVSTYAQGSGGVGGTGVLYDGAGDDRYYAGSVFEQGGAACGGIGILLDADGNDTYEEPAGFSQGMAATGIAATGCSDETGLGLGQRALDLLPSEIASLLDAAMIDETMRALPLGAVGILADGGGDDFYRSGWYGQGVQVGNAAGIVLDVSGNDRYVAAHCGQASGSGVSGPCVLGLSSPGIAALLDGTGDDAYEQGSWYGTETETGQGAGYGGSVVVLWDGSGSDTYTSPARDGGGFQTRGDHGVLVDLDPPPDKPDDYELPAPNIDPDDVDSATIGALRTGYRSLCWVEDQSWGCGWTWTSATGETDGFASLYQHGSFRETTDDSQVELIMDDAARAAALQVDFGDGCTISLGYGATETSTTQYSASSQGTSTGVVCSTVLGPESHSWGYSYSY